MTLLVHVRNSDDGRYAVLLARYLPRLAQQVRKLIVMCPESCAGLLATVQGVAEIRKPGDVRVAEYDLQVSLESLPWLFGTTYDDVPPVESGIDRELLRRRGAVRASVQTSGPIKRVGIVPALVGVESPSSFDARSPWSSQAFDSLLAFQNVTFYDLTGGTGQKAVMDRLKKLQAADCSGESPSLNDLALAILELDLVIGLDSTAVHLAGALGKPVWVLLGRVHDWYWPAAADRSPWYPTARIFRQSFTGKPDESLESVRAALAAWLA